MDDRHQYELSDAFVISNEKLKADRAATALTQIQDLPHITLAFQSSMPEGMREDGYHGLGIQVVGTPHFKCDHEIVAALETALHILKKAGVGQGGHDD